MRFLVALLMTFVLAACGTAPVARDPSPPPTASSSAEVEFLLASAATDFHTHRGSYPARFRDVRSGYALTAEGTRQYRLCGEFLPAQPEGHAEWIRFVTIRTDPPRTVDRGPGRALL